MRYTPHDRYFKKAKEQGYRSRAAYKLLELQQRFQLMKRGDTVVDLGAAPGGWLQVAANAVGQTGRVLGIDMQAIEPFRSGRILILQGDITSGEILEKAQDLLNRPVDAVLSDMAPRLSGIRDADAARCLELNRAALFAATRLLRPGGALLVKSFDNAELQTFTTELKNCFSSVKRTRPEATRHASSEVYFYAGGFHCASPWGSRFG